MRKPILLAVGIVLGLASATATAGLPAEVRRTLKPDPAVRSGTLPNGMRYFVRRANLPTHGLSVRFAINVGSFEEEEAERGYAHLIEHMAFRSTRSAPQGGIDRRFAALGAAFGRDQNGFTRLYSTSYKLDFADASDEAEAAAFAWARDIADGVIFTDAGIVTERGVVLAEKEAGDTPSTAARQQVTRFQLPRTRAANRDPSGDREALLRATPATLGRFYKHWYRPENAVLVVVGDRSVDEMEARITSTFSSWRPEGATVPRPPITPFDGKRAPEALQLTTPMLPAAVSACRFRPPEPRNDEVTRLRRETIDGVWIGIINRRYKALVDAGGSGMLGSSIFADSGQQEYASTCLVVVPAGDGWERPFAAAQRELRRFAKEGPTEQELEEQVEDARAARRGAVSAEPAQTADAIADATLAQWLDDRMIIAPREAMHAFDVAVEDVDPEAVRKRFAESWSGTGPLLALLTPKAAPAGAVELAWRRNDAAPELAHYVDRKQVNWAYPPSTVPGAIVSREAIADPGFTRVRYANGLILNFKRLEAEKGQVTLVARFGAGRHELPDADFAGATLGTGLFTEGGLGKMSAQEITASLAPVNWRFNFSVGAEVFLWTDSAFASNLATKLQVMAAFFTDPGFRPTVDERIGPAIDLMYRSYASQPEMTLSTTLADTLDPGNPGNLPARAALAPLKTADFARLLRPVIHDAPIELTIVGDIGQEEAERLVATTLGAMPTRTAAPRPATHPRFFRFPDRTVPEIRAVHQGPADRAVGELVWPLYVARPERRREERTLALVAAIFSQMLRDRVRVEMGKSYSPEVSTSMPDHADQGSLLATLQSNPTDMDELIAATAAVARAMAAGSFDQAALDVARRPMLANLAAQRATNGWWAAAISGSAANPALPTDAMGKETMLASISLEEVRTAARRWLSTAPFVAVAGPETTAYRTASSTAMPRKAH